MALDSFGDADGLALGERIAKRDVRIVDVVDAYIARIDALNPRLNAVVHRYYADARRRAVELDRNAATSPLYGVPLLLKDLLCEIADRPITYGSAFFSGYRSPRDSELYRRYKQAGLVVLGRTNCPELGLTAVTEPEAFGPTRNPWQPGVTPGGSSGGAAAAVSSLMVPLAHGGDGAGSLRIPASCCGVFGLKPSRGRTPLGPDASDYWLGMVQEHAITRSVRDSAALLDLTDGPETTSPYWAPPKERPYLEEVTLEPRKLRIGWTTTPPLPSLVHQECEIATESAARLCSELGHEVSEYRFDVDPNVFALHLFTLICSCTAATVRRSEVELGKTGLGGLETTTRLMVLLGQRFRADEVLASHLELQAIARRYTKLFERFDVLLTPTLSRPPVREGRFTPKGAEGVAREFLARARIPHVLEVHPIFGRILKDSFAFLPFTPIGNVSGVPSMSVPLHWSALGLPMGSCFSARLGDEGTLFRLAGQLERAKPWKDRLPDVNALSGS